MTQRITELAKALEAKVIERRRDLHRHAEAAWTEFRTASVVADALTALGYEVLAGAQVVAEEGMMGVPSAADLDKHAQRALDQGANPAWVATLPGGKLPDRKDFTGLDREARVRAWTQAVAQAAQAGLLVAKAT